MNKAIAAGALSLGALISTGASAQNGTAAFGTGDTTLTDVDSIRTMSGPLPFGSGLDETRPLFFAQTETPPPGTLGNTTFPALMDPDSVSGTTTVSPGPSITTTTPLAQTGAQTQAQTTVSPDVVPGEDQSWTAISGTVRFTSEDSFVVDYDEGSVRVQMSNWAWYDDVARTELVGSPVRVYGEVTDGLFLEQVIDAQALYVQNLGTYFHANDVNMRIAGFSVETPVQISTIELKGVVNTVEQTTFTIDMDQQQVTIDVAALEDNPLDDQGYQQIEPGELVIVEAPLYANFFANNWLQATSVVTLHRDDTRQNLIGVSADTTGEGTTPALSDDVGVDDADETDTDNTGAFGTDPTAEPFEPPPSTLP